MTPVVDAAWMLSVGADFADPETVGDKPRGNDLVGKYLDRLMRRSHTDGWLAERFFFRVIMLEQPPTSLFHPRVLWRTIRPRRLAQSHEFPEPEAHPTE